MGLQYEVYLDEDLIAKFTTYDLTLIFVDSYLNTVGDMGLVKMTVKHSGKIIEVA